MGFCVIENPFSRYDSKKKKSRVRKIASLPPRSVFPKGKIPLGGAIQKKTFCHKEISALVNAVIAK